MDLIKKALSSYTIIAAISCISLTCNLANSGERGHRLPPNIESQLSDSQKAQLEAATNREERFKLMKTFGIEMPPPGEESHHRGLPRFIEDQLSFDQKESLKNARTREEKRKLLDSWGIELPMPPNRGGQMSQEVEKLRSKYELAQSDQEKEAIRDEMRKLFFETDSDSEKGEIRHFLKDHPRESSNASETKKYKNTGAK